jgi:hypothetical protein
MYKIMVVIMVLLCYFVACSSHPMKKDSAMRTKDLPTDDLWDAFELDDDQLESEPEPGDFWGELDHDCDGIG